MGITITVSSAAGIKGVGVGKFFEEGLNGALFKKLLRFRYGLAATQVIARMKQDAPRDTGRLANSHGYAIDDAERRLVVFSRAGYAGWVHEGRKPGKRPPIEALLAWARRKVLNSRIATEKARAAAGVTLKPRLGKSATVAERDQARVLAFLVARKIGRFGTRPNKWFEGVLATGGIDQVAAQVFKAVEDYEQVLAEAMVAATRSAVDGANEKGRQP